MKYHAVIDAGSSGTRLFLYEVRQGAYPHVDLVAEVENATMPNGEREDGINNFIDPRQPELITSVVPLTIAPLLDVAATLLVERQVLPADVVVDLFATAGMRYTENMFGSAIVAAFYEQIRQGIVCAGFVAGEVRTSDGQMEEGVWTWINLNDLERDVFRTDNNPVGVVEVGGSSAQFSFPLPHRLDKAVDTKAVLINGRYFEVQCQTYLGLGQDDARKKMRQKLAAGSAVCFPGGFDAKYDVGDTLDGVGHFRLTDAGRFDFERCDDAYEMLIAAIDETSPLPDLTASYVEFVGTDAIFHATRYWEIEREPMLLAQMIMAYCHDHDAFPGIETNEFVQAQAANATYIRALLFGRKGLFSGNPEKLLGAIPNKRDGKTRLTWTRGYLLQKYAVMNDQS